MKCLLRVAMAQIRWNRRQISYRHSSEWQYCSTVKVALWLLPADCRLLKEGRQLKILTLYFLVLYSRICREAILVLSCKFCEKIVWRMNNQSINQSVNQSMNQWINQSIKMTDMSTLSGFEELPPYKQTHFNS